MESNCHSSGEINRILDTKHLHYHSGEINRILDTKHLH